MPTPIASTSARIAMRVAVRPRPTSAASARPARAAMRPSRLSRRLQDDERPPLAHQREERLVQRAPPSSRRTPTSTSTPCSRRIREAAAAARAGFGSSTAATTRRDAGVDDRGDARPGAAVWQHGSSVQYSVAPRARAPASSSACTSACGSPARSWKPCPTTTPSASTTTAPTSGFGLVRPRPRAAQKQRALHVVARPRQRRRVTTSLRTAPSTYSSGENGTRSSMPSPTPT